MSVKRTPVLVEIAKKLRAAGWQLQGIGLVLGIKGTTARCWIDDAYNEARIARNRARAAGRPLPPSGVYVTNNPEAATLLKEIPPDTRDLTAKLCGDPLPGRRAIDRKRGHNFPVDTLCNSQIPSECYRAQGVK